MPNDNKTIDWLLRIGVALQCAGHAWLVGKVLETPLLAWLWEPVDVGGLGLGEAAAVPIARVTGALLAVAAISTLVRPSRVLLVFVFVFQVVFAFAAWQTYEGFPLDVSWLGNGPLRGWGEAAAGLFPFAAGAARIAAPLVLLLVHWSKLRKLLGIAITPTVEWLLRISIALTFAAHGLEALQQRGSFLDMLIVSSERVLDPRLQESTAQAMLLVIGFVDLAVAGLILVRRWRLVAGYMAFWGFATAAVRLVALSPDRGWYEFAIRSSHWVLPLILVLAWRLAPAPDSLVKSNKSEG
ncbi:hypothetical protein [Aeoliella sp.]|uniref:hypothetical protein n=1 Tax=Aeoliella sp. TaxID=2795800 RepID=UPI003CCBB851